METKPKKSCKELEFDNLTEFYSWQRKLNAKAQIDGWSIFYRGAKGSLLPSIVDKTKIKGVENLKRIEEEMLEDFINKGNLNLEISNKTLENWYYRFIAREHELFSSLMDWSGDFKILLEFSTKFCRSPKFEKSNIYILLIPAVDIIHESEYAVKDFNDFQTIKMIKVRITFNLSNIIWQRRIFLQTGAFLFQPYDIIENSLETNLPDNWELYKVTITKKQAISIRRKLRSKVDLRKNSIVSSKGSKKEKLDRICKKINDRFSYEKNKHFASLKTEYENINK